MAAKFRGEMIDGVFVNGGEWTGYTVRPSRKGWIIETWSQIQSTITDRKLLVPYSGDAPEGADLMSDWNLAFKLGDIIHYWSRTHETVRVLRKGHRVQ